MQHAIAVSCVRVCPAARLHTVADPLPLIPEAAIPLSYQQREVTSHRDTKKPFDRIKVRGSPTQTPIISLSDLQRGAVQMEINFLGNLMPFRGSTARSPCLKPAPDWTRGTMSLHFFSLIFLFLNVLFKITQNLGVENIVNHRLLDSVGKRSLLEPLGGSSASRREEQSQRFRMILPVRFASMVL
ncbi:UNVERIFIED_CONTAM: hypothetical protein FKN15_055799 [Acipenser sinensis]